MGWENWTSNLIDLVRALRLSATSRLALVGAGGKSSVLLTLAASGIPFIATTTTHLAVEQAAQFSSWLRVKSEKDLAETNWPAGSVLVTGQEPKQGRIGGIENEAEFALLLRIATERRLPVIVEADGAKRLMLKAPAKHEPAIPEWITHVLVVMGAGGVGKPLSSMWVHRPELFAELSGLKTGELVSWDALERVLLHEQGGLKNIPPGARRSVLVHQVETDEEKIAAAALARQLLDGYNAVLIGALSPQMPNILPGIETVFERVGGVILAAGGSRRMGGIAKPLLMWRGKPLIKHVVENAMAGGLSPIVVVAGQDAEAICAVLEGMDIVVVHHLDWATGQSSSIRCGLKNLPQEIGAAVFLLADQPYVSAVMIAKLRELHSRTLAAIVAPRVDGRRTNPVLFDRRTFSSLEGLQGDIGGRAIFEQYRQDWAWLDWQDERLLFDVDTMSDYERLLADEQ